jgi:NADPH:quinone reductase-like Zn-dependent oxidoreductase
VPAMRIIRQSAFGGPEVLRRETVERPAPAGTEVLVRVRAAGVNPIDWKTRAGRGVLHTLPCTVGWDVSGVVEATGHGVTRFAPGDEVFGMPWFPRQAAAYAEFVTAPSRHFAAKPAVLDHLQAAALPLAGLTAWQALVDTARLGPGQRALIAAAGGGVGHLAVQIAKARGAQVIATASGPKLEFVRALGADEVVDYTRVDPVAAAGEVDVVLDTVGPTTATAALGALRPGGVLVTIAGGPAPEAARAAAAQRGIRSVPLLVEPDHAGLAALAALADAGRLRVEIAAVLPLEQAGAAHELGERGHTRGKIVLQVAET